MRAAIFVVDDQRDVAEATAGLLESWGHEVTIETRGKRALEILLGPDEFDATFLDILMPDMTGGEIYVQLKKLAPARLRRLCFMTGMGHLVDRWLASTGLPVIEKGDPDVPEKLAKIVQQYAALSCSRGPKSNEPSSPEIFVRDSLVIENQEVMPSAHDLRKLLSQNAEDEDDDDDGADDSGVLIEKFEQHRTRSSSDSRGGSSSEDDRMTYAVVEYLHKKTGRLTKRVGKIEKKIDHATWVIVTASAIGSFLVSVLYKVFEKYVMKQ